MEAQAPTSGAEAGVGAAAEGVAVGADGVGVDELRRCLLKKETESLKAYAGIRMKESRVS